MTQVLFPALTWRFTIVLILVPRNLMPSVLAPGMHMMHIYASKQSYTNKWKKTEQWMSLIPALRVSRVQGHLQLHREVQASKRYMRPCGNGDLRAWRDASAVKNTRYSCRVPRISSQHSQTWWLTTICKPSSREAHTFWPLQGSYMKVVHMDTPKNTHIKYIFSQVWWYMFLIPELSGEFKASLVNKATSRPARHSKTLSPNNFFYFKNQMTTSI